MLKCLSAIGGAALTAVLCACGDVSTLSFADGTGPDPTLPPPDPSLIPVVNIAPARGWEPGESPEPASGFSVAAFATDLDHPRWLYRLPNGDVLVAETAAPEQEGIGGPLRWIMNVVMRRAGSAVPSANRITLLRDRDGDGIVDERTAFLEDLNSPFGMTLVGEELYIANTDALLRFPYRDGQTRIDAAGERVADLPAGDINYHWTKNVIASPDGSRLYVTVGSNSNIAENGRRRRRAPERANVGNYRGFPKVDASSLSRAPTVARASPTFSDIDSDEPGVHYTEQRSIIATSVRAAVSTALLHHELHPDGRTAADPRPYPARGS